MLALLVLSLPTLADVIPEAPPTNKLLYMYRFYYLPFSLEFREGKNVNEILPLLPQKDGTVRLIKADELQELDTKWNSLRDPWKQKSLLLSTPVTSNESARVTTHLVSHVIPLTRTALERLSIDERIQINETLKKKPVEVQSAFKQLTFLKSFLTPMDQGKWNLFIFSASWCESCREYRVLLESYLKKFPSSDLNLHSVVIEDSREEIFDKPLLKELFPNPKKYSHDSIPRFLMLDTTATVPKVLEEGEALAAVYDRFFKEHKGFLDEQSPLFKKSQPARRLSSEQ